MPHSFTGRVCPTPVLENEIISRDTKIERSKNKAQELEAENDRLKSELRELKLKMEEEKRESERKTKVLEDEIVVLKKTTSFDSGSSSSSSNRVLALESDEHTSCSQRFVEVPVRSSVLKSLKKTTSDPGSVSQKHFEFAELKREAAENVERLCHSWCNSEKLDDSTDSVLATPVRSRAPRVPKPTPRPSSSSPPSPSSGSSDLDAGSVAANFPSQPHIRPSIITSPADPQLHGLEGYFYENKKDR